MIIVTLKGSKPPLPGRVKGVVVWPVDTASPCDALASAMGHFRNEKDAFLYVSPGAQVATVPVHQFLQKADFDVASCVDRIGSTPTVAVQFDGIGRVSLETILVRPGVCAWRLLERWVERNAVSPGRDEVNLCIALRETTGVRFRFLGPEWRWRAGTPGNIAESVVWFPGKTDAPIVAKFSPPPKQVTEPIRPYRSKSPEVLQSGHFLSWASYGRLNREILFRIGNTINVRAQSDGQEAVLVDEYTAARVRSFQSTLIGPHSPILRIFGPDHEPQKGRFSINFTLMETDRVHPDMVSKINSRYDELWSCTRWGINAFIESGVKVPTRVVPLGVNSAIFRPMKRKQLPECLLVSTSKRGTTRRPSGWIALAVGLPSRRKNFEFVAEAIELAFSGRNDVDFVIATTHAPGAWSARIHEKLAPLKTRVWILEGKFTDMQMAEIYNSSDAIVSASLGEGWGLPAHEMAACRKPVIVPRNSAHPDVLGEDAWMFDRDGTCKCPEAESVSPWYVGADWPKYGAKARKQLAELIRTVHAGGGEVRERTERLCARMRRMTWDETSEIITERLIEVQP